MSVGADSWWCFNEPERNTQTKAKNKNRTREVFWEILEKSSYYIKKHFCDVFNSANLVFVPVRATTYNCVSFLQEAVLLMSPSLSVITNKILMMTLTGCTSTPRICHMFHQTCHKVRLNSLFPVHLQRRPLSCMAWRFPCSNTADSDEKVINRPV